MYLHTTILVKLLVIEPDSEFFQQELAGKLISSSELALADVQFALFAKERSKAISGRQRAAAWRLFNERVREREIHLHPLNGVVLKKANHIIEKCHPVVALRALDAIHLASCDMSQDFPLCTTDRRMRDAAKVLGIPVFPEVESA